MVKNVLRTGCIGLKWLHSTFFIGVKNVLTSVFGSINVLDRNVSAFNESRVIPATIQLKLTLMTGSSTQVTKRNNITGLCS